MIDVNLYYCCIICNTVFVCISSLNSVICAIIHICKQQTGWLVTWGVLVGCMSLGCVSRCARIYSMTFSSESLFLACSSNTETVHIFKLEDHKEKYVCYHGPPPYIYPFRSSCSKIFHPRSLSLCFSISIYNFSSLPKVTEFIFKYEISWKTAM